MAGTRCALVWKRCASPVHSPLPAVHRHGRLSSLTGREASLVLGRLLTPHPATRGGENHEISHQDAPQDHICSLGTHQRIDNIAGDSREAKLSNEKESYRASHNHRTMTMTEDSSVYVASLTASTLQFSLLIENINEIEDILADTDLVRLERDILAHIGRLGALKLFHACLSRTPTAQTDLSSNILLAETYEECSMDSQVDELKANKIVYSGKKDYRKLRRSKALNRASKMCALSTSSPRKCEVEEPTASSSSGFSQSVGSSKARSRSMTARSESKLSRGVKEVAGLEEILIKLEKETGRTASYARWAAAAGIDPRTLHRRLQYGWYCRDELIKSMHSLVVYLAKNYRGMGIAFDDLLQAGSMGVLQGAERFDSTRGYRFSTYIQYWIRKSMLALVARHSRGICVPAAMEKIINQIQKGRRALHERDGTSPIDDEIAEFTGFSLANVRLASKCGRTVGSIDQEMGSEWPIKFREVTPDISVKTPDEIITGQHIRKDVFDLLEALQPRERQVLVLRYGLDDGRCKSLGEIGRLFRVTKEWIRKIEKAALVKIRRQGIQKELKYCLYS